MKKFSFWLLVVVLLLSGCEKKITTELHDIHWDRDMCKRCAMIVSDRKHTVQAINPKDGRSYMFDDIGCTVLWFHDEKIQWKKEAVLWVTDSNSGEWIDAKKAYYTSENVTSMAYGFMAHKTKPETNNEIVDFSEVSKRIIKIGK
jgi:nitrous oxide reductase accessory protein NosL